MKKILVQVLLMFISVWAFSQASYLSSFVVDGGNPNGINTVSDGSTTGFAEILGPSLAANQWSAVQAIPFVFEFYGDTVTHYKVSANGVVTFDTSAIAVPGANGSLPSASIPDKSICGMWESFTSSPPTGTNDRVYARVYGTAPNRQYWIKWYSYEYGSLTSVALGIVFEESSNNVYVVDMGSAAGGTTTVGVQLNSSSAVQYGNSNIAFYGNSTSNSNDNDYYVFEPYTISANDAKIASILSPVNPAAGNQNISVVLENFGNNVINNVTVNWEVNGVLQTPYNYSNPIAVGGSTGTVVIGTYTFSNPYNSLKVYTSNPNGAIDVNNFNDTLSAEYCSGPLSGSYNIGGTSPDFDNFTESVFALNNCGISSPVVIHIADNTYNENFELSYIQGSSATNTVTFVGESRDSTILHHIEIQAGAIQLDSVHNLILKNFTIDNPIGTYNYGVHMRNKCNNIQFDSLKFILNAPFVDHCGIVGSDNLSDIDDEGAFGNNISISHCFFDNGYYAIFFNGSSTDTNQYASNISIFDNMFEGSLRGVDLNYVDSIEINQNTITDVSTGVYMLRGNNVNISSNRIEANSRGLDISNLNTNIETGESWIVNNFIDGYNAGIDLSNIKNTRFYHNTVKSNMLAALLSGCDSFSVINNIFVSKEDQMISYNDTIDFVLDYNLYYKTGNDTNNFRDGFIQYSSLAAWQAGNTTINMHSLEGNPDFYSSTDMHVYSSYFDNMGDPALGIATDIDGQPRPAGANPDMGADEYTAFLNDVKLIEVTNPISANRGCHVSGDSIVAKVLNYGSATINLSNSPVVFNTSLTGANNDLYQFALNTGLWASHDTMDVVIHNVNLPDGGTTNFSAYISNTADMFLPNDSIHSFATILTYAPNITVSSDSTTICEGSSVQLLAQSNLMIPSFNNVYSSTHTTPISDTIAFSTDSIVISGLPYNANQLVFLIIDSLMHDIIEEIEIKLIAPDSSEIFILDYVDGDNDANMLHTFISDTASTRLDNGHAPYTGHYSPADPISSLTGSANGTWKIVVADYSTDYHGNLFKWSLAFPKVNGAMYSWSPSTTLNNSTIENPIATPTNTTTYLVQVIDSMGCSKSDSITINVVICTGLNNPEAQVLIYPNPAVDYFNIDFGSLPHDQYLLEVINLGGQVVMSQNILYSGNTTNVDVSNLTAGSYIVSIKSSSETFKGKLLVE